MSYFYGGERAIYEMERLLEEAYLLEMEYQAEAKAQADYEYAMFLQAMQEEEWTKYRIKNLIKII